ncbi:hypothetical protein PVAP13_8NG272201 [Panicum virgatum]|uniref:Uncharacterized protein n=1 Tax=Panicum virgatum TaxID=38727 RepID=A0A8T0PC56_PANVG|nr:hypothetical protein PVAP13_8NG272201 [Panicum virgatum]
MAMAYSGLHLAWCPRVAASCRPSGATGQWRGRDRVVPLPQLTPLCQLSCVESNNAKALIVVLITYPRMLIKIIWKNELLSASAPGA